MRVNESTFVQDLEVIMENYQNDKTHFPWSAEHVNEAKGNKITLEMYMNTIANINSLDRYANKYRDVNLDQWMVPAIFAPLVMPKRVTVDNSDDAINLIDTTKEHVDKTKKVDGKVVLPSDLSHEEFMKVNHALRRIYRKDESTWFVSVKELRTEVLLTDVLDRIAHDDVTPEFVCMPIQLQIKFYSPESYVYNVRNVAKRFMEKHIAKELGGSQKSNN